MSIFTNTGPPKVEEGRYSFGTTPAIEVIFQEVQKIKSHTGIFVAINISTLIRNRWDKNKKIDEVSSLVRSDMMGIATEVSDVCKQYCPNHLSQLVYYFHNYTSFIPAQYYRGIENSEQKRLIHEISEFLKNIIKPGKQGPDKNFEVIALHPDAKLPMYQILDDMAYRIGGKQMRFMISHIPVDFHFFKKMTPGFIVKSHTGEKLDGTDSMIIGNYVFKSPLPFTKITHVLLGDKEVINKSIGAPDRKRLLELSEVEKWKFRTDAFISESVKNNKFTLPYTLP